MTDLPTTRDACDALIAKLTAHRDSLSLPARPIAGHLYQDNDGGQVFLACLSGHGVRLFAVAKYHSPGTCYSFDGEFHAEDFTHLGPAADLLMLKTDAPQLVTEGSGKNTRTGEQ